MGSDSILAGIGATVLAVTLLVCGFAACCLPVTTASLAGAVSTGADSPYTHEQLVSLAQETRAFTVDAHSSMEEARESLAADVVAAAREASAEGAPKYSQWTQQAKQVLGDAEGEGGARWPRTVARPVARPLVPMARRLRPWTRWRRCPTATPWTPMR